MVRAPELPLASPQGHDQLSAIVADARLAGLPDLSGARFRIGRLAITTVRTGASGRATSSSALIQASACIGLHAQLANGSWLAGLARLVVPGAHLMVDAEETVAVAHADLPRTACRVVGWQSQADPRPLDGFLDADLPRIRAALALAPIPMLTELGACAAMALPALLAGSGCDELSGLATLAAVAMAEGDRLAPPDRPGALILGEVPCEELPALRGAPLQPAIAVARGVLDWLLATAEASAPTAQRQWAVLRLIAWLPWAAERQRLLRLCRQAGLLGGSRSPMPGSSAMPALIDGMADDQVSAWRDQDSFGRPVARTVGDACLAALARHLGRDPRPLVGIDPSLPWDDALRQELRRRLLAASLRCG